MNSNIPKINDYSKRLIKKKGRYGSAEGAKQTAHNKWDKSQKRHPVESRKAVIQPLLMKTPGVNQPVSRSRLALISQKANVGQKSSSAATLSGVKQQQSQFLQPPSTQTPRANYFRDVNQFGPADQGSSINQNTARSNSSSKNIQIECCNNLYQQALSRQNRQHERETSKASRQSDSIKRDMNKRKMTVTSEKYYVQKITREIIRSWQAMEMQELAYQNETMLLKELENLLIATGFLKDETAPSSAGKYRGDFKKDSEKAIQNKMLNQVWKTLAGRKLGHITLNNTRMFLLAVQGILIDHAPEIERDGLEKMQSLGKINSHGDIFFDQNDLVKIQRKFKLLNTNRLQFEIYLKAKKKAKKTKDPECTFRPKISQKSRDVAKKIRNHAEKFAKASSTLSHGSSNRSAWMARSARDQSWQDQAEQQRRNSEMTECTFRPRLSTRTNFIADRAQPVARSAGGSLTHRIPSLHKAMENTESTLEPQTLRENQDIESVVTTESEQIRRKARKQRKEEQWLERQKENIKKHAKRMTSLKKGKRSKKQNARSQSLVATPKPVDISKEDLQGTIKQYNTKLFNELFEDSRDKQKRFKQDVCTEDIEFQRAKTECTFHPQTLKETKIRNGKLNNRHGSTPRDQRKLSAIKGVEDMVARQKLARQWQSNEQDAMEQGKHINDGPVVESQKRFHEMVTISNTSRELAKGHNTTLGSSLNKSNIIQTSYSSCLGMLKNPYLNQSRNSFASTNNKGRKKTRTKKRAKDDSFISSRRNSNFLTNPFPVNIVTTPNAQDNQSIGMSTCCGNQVGLGAYATNSTANHQAEPLLEVCISPRLGLPAFGVAENHARTFDDADQSRIPTHDEVNESQQPLFTKSKDNQADYNERRIKVAKKKKSSKQR